MATTKKDLGIDSLLDDLNEKFEVNQIKNSIYAPHPTFQNLYKSKPSRSDQESRRKKALEIQRKKRADTLNNLRCLVEGSWDGMDTTEESEDDEYKPGRFYKNQLMLSEWLIDVPENFQDNFIMVACPTGKRVLVVAAKGKTKVFSKSGRKILGDFPSELPGGNVRQSSVHFGKTETVLDCIFNEALRTFFILDLMCWSSHPIYDSETEFRFYWLKTKYEEEGGNLNTMSKYNKFRFVNANRCDCSKESIEKLMVSTTREESHFFDGLLFYHKEALYTFGTTPLVGWLKPFMITEILKVTIPDYFQPVQLVTQSEFIRDYQNDRQERIEKNKEKQKRRKDKEHSIDQS
ncbi:DgyrCDS12125 [Dimorphilus gyrociliatus]|uniref:Snurportin-1 n=1 Tax=Dimorphilus gyrociliatus TaxID=2664684 RepID=A0A7I8W6D7_9ANNE|nr:DgyrCDS12125 [Dimorphilus gyrociliatus]